MRGSAGPTTGPKAQASAQGSAQIGAASNQGQRGRATAIGPLNNDAGILRVYVLAGDASEIVAPLDRNDATFRDPTLLERARSLIGGHGW